MENYPISWWVRALAMAFMLSCAKLSNAAIDYNIVSTVEQYFATLPNIAADFSQASNNHKMVCGKLIIVRPNKFRCNYYLPYPLLITGNTQYIAIYDYELEQLTKISNKNLNAFNLLTKGLTLNEQLKVVATSSSKEHINIVLIDVKQDIQLDITLTRNPLELKILKIIDQNNYNILEFTKLTPIKSAKPELFTIKNPEIFGQPKRLDAVNIKEYYE